jgi:hypothetical protein
MSRHASWRISAEVRQQIAALPASISSRAAAERFGVDRCTILNIRREFGVPIPRRGAQKIWGRSMHAGARNILRLWPIQPRGRRPLLWAMEESIA